MPGRSRLAIAAALVAGTVLRPAPAAAIEDLLTPRSVAMGQSLRADATGALGPLLNPAGMPMRRAYNIEAMYGFRVQDRGSNLHASIVDSVTSRLSASVWYSFVNSKPKLTLQGIGEIELKREGHETGLGLALPLGDRFAFGLSAKYIRVTTDYENPFFDPKNNPDQPERVTLDSTISDASADGFTLDAGLNLRLADSFSIGVVGRNLVPLRSIEAPMQLGTGLAYRLGTALTLALDYVVYFNRFLDPATRENLITHRLGGGLEWLIKGRFAIRAGSYWDSGEDATYFTYGLAYVGTSFAIDLAHKQQVDGGLEATILAGVRIFLQ